MRQFQIGLVEDNLVERFKTLQRKLSVVEKKNLSAKNTIEILIKDAEKKYGN